MNEFEALFGRSALAGMACMMLQDRAGLIGCQYIVNERDVFFNTSNMGPFLIHSNMPDFDLPKYQILISLVDVLSARFATGLKSLCSKYTDHKRLLP